jgi:hypothetical protein
MKYSFSPQFVVKGRKNTALGTHIDVFIAIHHNTTYG